ETMRDSWRDEDNVPLPDDLCCPATDPRACLIAHSTGRFGIEHGPATFKGGRTLLDPVQVDEIAVHRRRFRGAMEEIQAEQLLPLEEPSGLCPLYPGLKISEREHFDAIGRRLVISRWRQCILPDGHHGAAQYDSNARTTEHLD